MVNTRALLPLSSVLFVLACRDGNLAGVGSPCDEVMRCRAFLQCMEGRCEPGSPTQDTSAPPDTLMDGDAGVGPDLRPTTDMGSSVDVYADGEGTPDAATIPDAPAIPDARQDTASLVADVAVDNRPPMLDAPSPPPPVATPLTDLNAFGGTKDGRLFHWVQRLDARTMTWIERGDVTRQAGNLGPMAELDAETLGPSEIHLLARSGSRIAATRWTGTKWSSWQTVIADGKALALTQLKGVLTACLLDKDGRLLLARASAGEWGSTEVVPRSWPADAGAAPSFVNLDCIAEGDDLTDLDVYLVDDRGRVFTMTHSSAGWTGPRLFDPAVSFMFEKVDVARVSQNLQILAVSPMSQWHALRVSTKDWEQIFPIESETGVVPGDVVDSAFAGIATEAHLLRVTAIGELWHAARFRNNFFSLFVRVGVTTGTPPFITAAALTASHR